MGSWDAGSVESNRSGKLAPSLTELALLCWDQVGTVPRAQRALPAALPPVSPTAWAGPGNSAHGHPGPALGSGRHQTMWPGGGWKLAGALPCEPVPVTQLPGGQHRALTRGPGPGPGCSSSCCFSRAPGLPQGQGTASWCPLVGSLAGHAWKETLAGSKRYRNTEMRGPGLVRRDSDAGLLGTARPHGTRPETPVGKTRAGCHHP